MATPKANKGRALSPEVLAKMDKYTDKLFELVEPQLEMILSRYVYEAQRSDNTDILIDLVNRLVGKSAPRVQPEQDSTTTINILTHGGSVDTYRLSSPGKAIDAEYDSTDPSA